MRGLVVLLVLCSICNAVLYTAEHCLELGFRQETLLCSACDRMKEFVRDEALLNECHSCCESDHRTEIKQYPMATLVVCK